MTSLSKAIPWAEENLFAGEQTLSLQKNLYLHDLTNIDAKLIVLFLIISENKFSV